VFHEYVSQLGGNEQKKGKRQGSVVKKCEKTRPPQTPLSAQIEKFKEESKAKHVTTKNHEKTRGNAAPIPALNPIGVERPRQKKRL